MKRKLNINLANLAILLAFIITLGTGLWFAVEAGRGKAILEIFTQAIFAFVLIILLFVWGLYQRYAKDLEQLTQANFSQLELLDVIQKNQQALSFDELADRLEASRSQISEALKSLVDLQVFSGYINWNQGIVGYLPSEKGFPALCITCQARLEPAQNSLTCPNCQTIYYLG